MVNTRAISGHGPHPIGGPVTDRRPGEPMNDGGPEGPPYMTMHFMKWPRDDMPTATCRADLQVRRRGEHARNIGHGPHRIGGPVTDRRPRESMNDGGPEGPPYMTMHL